MANCQKCGARVEEGDEFCPDCGAKIIPAGAAAARPGVFIAVKPGKHRFLKAFIIILVIIFLFRAYASFSSQPQLPVSSEQYAAEIPAEGERLISIETPPAEINPLLEPLPNDNANVNTNIMLETSIGNIKIQLFDDKVPVTAGNFKKLVNDGFYNGIIFHRVIDNFMIQGGDPTGTGMGGPGYTIPDEFHQSLAHSKPGIVSMANLGPNTGGSQFFITLAATPWLDGNSVIFGEIVEGMDVAQAIGKVAVGQNDRPLEDVVINNAYVVK